MFDAFILAGGKSSRMGRDKASIEFDGISLLERASAVLREAGAAGVSVVFSGRSELQVPDSIALIHDEFVDGGALAGIHAALNASVSGTAFIAACDLPFASAELARKLIEALEKGEADCAIPEQPDGQLQPLFAAYRRDAALGAAEHILREPGASKAVGNFTDRLEPKILRFEEYSRLAHARRLLKNVNTPEELESALFENGPRI
ncbi:MAG TPA: molybdenum cofactor guanylyltransferase [Aridibacter sp.]|nr:molybdenum cofactor guanylyltransferase [Aridibacter sp.]